MFASLFQKGDRQVGNHSDRNWFSTRILLFLCGALLGLIDFPGSSPILSATDEGEEFFERRIRPLLVKHCFECHSGVNSEGGLLLDSRQGWQKGGEGGTAIIPGKPNDSLLIQAVRYQHADLAMPPEEAGGKLSDAQIALLEKWVRIGAPDPRNAANKLGGMTSEEAQKWWAFQELPKAEQGFGSSEIDSIIEKKLAEEELQPVPLADKRTLIRRATYDLTGLPPTPEEASAFLADKSPDAFAKLVDRLLDSPQYGVHWGRHWLDVVRYADTAGENTDRPLPHAWRYRNWVIDSFNQDKAFDEFVRLQIAGDLIRSGQSQERLNEGVIATGYLAIARRFGHDIDKRRYLMYEDVIDNLGKSFLGLTTGCSRCHDHKYDPITSKDYYALYGIFESTRFSFPGCEPKGQPRDLVPLVSQNEVDSLMQSWNEKVALAEKEKERLDKLANQLKSLSVQHKQPIVSRTMVGEGANVPWKDLTVTMRKGEVLQLTVFPNGSHGADSTQIEWKISQKDGPKQTWDIRDLVPQISKGNPLEVSGGARWCFFESTNAPAFLQNAVDALPENASLKAWKRTGDALSVFVNTSDQPVKVWTTLAAKAFFVHPEQNRPVSVAFVSPLSGEFTISGAVIDAHPIGGDGVSFELMHVASEQYGEALVDLGERSRNPASEPGPKPTFPVAYAVADNKPVNAPFQRRGDPEQLGEPVQRRWLSVFGSHPLKNPGESGRRELAHWITQHPLTARVIVNRIWQWHFGSGLVRTPNNFGSRGQDPSHPELLDKLAAIFVANGQHLKPLHRLIMNTAAYQRSSEVSIELNRVDPDNKLMGRFGRRRLTAEEIRDSLLSVSGELDQTPAQGHPFPDESSWRFTQHDPFNAVYHTNRRSVYLMVQRQRRHPFLSLFDGADPNASTPNRQTSTVPTQALYFLNDPFFHRQASALAERLLTKGNEEERVRLAYRVVFQRQPSSKELQTAKQFLERYPADVTEKWRSYSRILLASNEFIHVD